MNAVLLILAVVLLLTIVLALGAVGMRNKFATQRDTLDESWRQIDVELQRRHDLIGNLVEVVQASTALERSTLDQVVRARVNAVAQNSSGPLAQSRTERDLNGALAGFLRGAESYSDLQANRDFRYLRERITEADERIAASSRYYNHNVQAYNTRFDTFPASLFTGTHEKAEYYELTDPNVRAAPSVRGAFN